MVLDGWMIHGEEARKIALGIAMPHDFPPHGGAALEPWQIVGPRHARPLTGAARSSGPAEADGFDTAHARLPGQWQVGTNEQAL